MTGNMNKPEAMTGVSSLTPSQKMRGSWRGSCGPSVERETSKVAQDGDQDAIRSRCARAFGGADGI